MATIQLLDGYTAYSENGIYHYYGTVQDWYAIDRYGSKKAWMISELTQFGHISPADTVIDIDGSVIQKGTMTASEIQAELNQQAQDIIDEANRKAAWEISQAELFADFAQNNPDSGILPIAQEKVSAVSGVVSNIQTQTKNLLSSLQGKTYSSDSVSISGTPKNSSTPYWIILIALFGLFIYMFRK